MGVLGIALLMLIPVAPAAHAPLGTTGRRSIDPLASAVNASLSIGSFLGSHGADPFYAVVFTPIGLGPNSAAALGKYFNSTPINWFRLSEGAEGYDPTTQTSWVAPASGGTYVPVSEQLLNFSWFKSWCYSKTPHCNWIGTLPAEENSTSYALHVAKWFHQVLGFAPTAWQFGNEPNAWTHYGKNVTAWSTTDAHAPTGWDYATMVRNYVAAISKVFPQDRFIGIEANCACGKSQIPTTAQVDASKLMGMAYHEYPWLTNSSTSVSQFMGSLNASTAIPSFASKMRTLDTQNCTTCSSLPIEIGEYQAGIFNDHSPLAHTYAGGPFLGASVIEALESNISMFTVYALGDMYNSTNGSLLPEGVLYQRILDNFTMGQDYAVTVTAPGVGGVYALLAKNGTTESLLIINTNTTKSIKFLLGPTVFPVGTFGDKWVWGPSLSVPKFTAGTVPRSYVLQPLVMVMLTS